MQCNSLISDTFYPCHNKEVGIDFGTAIGDSKAVTLRDGEGNVFMVHNAVNGVWSLERASRSLKKKKRLPRKRKKYLKQFYRALFYDRPPIGINYLIGVNDRMKTVLSLTPMIQVSREGNEKPIIIRLKKNRGKAGVEIKF